MNLFTISTAEPGAVNAIAVKQTNITFAELILAALQIAELLLVISGYFNSIRRTDRSTELRIIITKHTNTQLQVVF